jgi:hypothetical protein
MTEKYLTMNNEIFIFHPETHEVFRVAPQRIELLKHSEEMKTLRLRAVEITRQQAEQAAPSLRKLSRPAP